MSEYPEDIMKAAQKAIDHMPDLKAMMDPSEFLEVAEEAVAAAILAERERRLQQVIADIDHAKENWAGPVLMKLRRQYSVALDRLKGGAA